MLPYGRLTVEILTSSSGPIVFCLFVCGFFVCFLVTTWSHPFNHEFLSQTFVTQGRSGRLQVFYKLEADGGLGVGVGGLS